MRIGNLTEATRNDSVSIIPNTTNYSKADFKQQVRIDITGIGKDTDFLVDQGRSLQDVKDIAGALDVQSAQDYMTVMSNTMSKEDYSKMMEDGFDPSEMSGEQAVTILDHIKAVMAESGQIVSGYNDDLDVDTLIGITGSEANANSLVNAMKQADIPVSKENAHDIEEAAERLSQVGALDGNAIRYMIENHLAPTIENVYRASFSSADMSSGSMGYYALDNSGYLGKKSDVTSDQFSVDISTAINRFGIEEYDYSQQIEAANWLLENDLNVTAENVRVYCDLSTIVLPLEEEAAYQIAAAAIKEGKSAKAANLLPSYEDVYTKAARIYADTQQITDKAVGAVEDAGKTLNLLNLSAAQRQIQIEAGQISIQVASSSAGSLDGRLALEEVRLRMSLDVNISLLKRGISIDTMPISQLVDEMKQEQEKLQKLFLGEGSETEVTEKASIYKETRQVIKDIPYLPAATIGRIKLEEQYSLSKVHETGTELKAKYETAGQSYEALMTVPRRDMGDSISKAFQNVDDILADIGMEAVEENRKAVRILGYNSMTINAEAINKIKEEMSIVLDVVNNLTPAKTLALIRNNINPLDMKLEELSLKLKEMDTDSSDEKYSSFLYRLERNGDISEKERASFIGIYRLMNRLEKTDGASVGAMVSQDRDITFRSLLSGMRSSKVSFDISIDDSFGFLDTVISKGVSITDQIDEAFSKQYESNASEYSDTQYKEYMDELSKAADVAGDVLKQYEVPVTLSNVSAYNALSSAEGNVYKKLMAFSEESEETDRLLEAFEKMSEGLEDRDTAIETFEHMQSVAENYIQYMKDYKIDSYADMRTLLTCSKQLSVGRSLSSNEDYVIPMQTEDGLSTVRLTFKHDGLNKGKVDIILSEAAAHLSLEENRVHGLIVCESRASYDQMNRAITVLNDSGYECNVNVVIGKENQRSTYDFNTNTDINNVDTKSLYKLAKEFVKAGIEA